MEWIILHMYYTLDHFYRLRQNCKLCDPSGEAGTVATCGGARVEKFVLGKRLEPQICRFTDLQPTCLDNHRQIVVLSEADILNELFVVLFFRARWTYMGNRAQYCLEGSRVPVVLERQIQKIYPGKWDELDAIDKKYDAVEKKYDFPPKRRYRAYSASGDTDTIIIEREWKSMAKYEEALYKLWVDPEEQKLNKEGEKIIKHNHVEFYLVWPLRV
jgi:hypothetical protein